MAHKILLGNGIGIPLREKEQSKDLKVGEVRGYGKEGKK